MEVSENATSIGAVPLSGVAMKEAKGKGADEFILIYPVREIVSLPASLVAVR